MDVRKSIPNALSFTRLALAGVFPLIPPPLRLATIIVALLTEFFDGYLARRLNAITDLGQALDPIADKIFILIVILTLISEGEMTWQELVWLGFRDLVVSIGSITLTVLRGERFVKDAKPRVLGKLATALQFAFLVFLFAWPPLRVPLFYLTVAVSIVSGVDYILAMRHMWRMNMARESHSIN
jgi:phosphatidylglycerophosphate synthase